jgi:hypothetical protein
MHDPNGWPNLAKDLIKLDESLDDAAAETNQSFEFPQTSGVRRDDDGPVSYATPAITCADAVDLRGGVTAKMIFDSLVETEGPDNHICKPLYHSF